MNKTLSNRSRRSFFLKVIMPSIVAVMLFILSFYVFIIPTFENTIMDRKREMIRELTNSVWSVLLKYEKEELDSLSTRHTAQQKAINEIRQIRYGDEMKDYFWITDMQPNMIMHPYRGDLDGQSLSDFKDAHGKYMFVEFVNVVKKQDQGYVDYMWQWKDDSLRIVPKLSYVKLFKPWGWIVGTGIYLEDVKSEMRALIRNLIWISAGISLLIALLLLFISQQSFRIERKRIDAENALHEAKEKYRALVEHATEGLIMLINGKISFSNHIITKLTGYDYNELNNVSISTLISQNNLQEIIQAFSKKIVSQGQYEMNLKKKDGGYVEVLLTASTPVFAKEVVNIITIKDISIDRSANLSALDYQKLISTLNMGFFRARLDHKGKFMFANETTLGLLGYKNFKELSEINILELLVNIEDRKNLRSDLMQHGYIKNKVLQVFKKNRQTAIVSATLVVLKTENPKELLCDGIIEDISEKESEKAEMKELIALLNAGNIQIHQPIYDLIKAAVTINVDATIQEAVQMFSGRKTDNLLVTKTGGNEVIGIVTDKDIQQRVLSLNLHLDNPIYLIMSSPVRYIAQSGSMLEAINICDELNISHLPVKNDLGQIAGVVCLSDVFTALKNSLVFNVSCVNNAPSTEDLRDCYHKFRIHITSLIQNETSVRYITKISSTFSDAIIHRIIALVIKEIGDPPVGFSFICLGSEGRKEETLLTDQDNAIIYEDVAKDKEELTQDYFIKFGEKVCNALNRIGYAFCKGNIMAMNPQWCKPFSVWEKYFATWITSPEPQNLLDASVFFDFRHIYGDENVCNGLKKSMAALISQHPLFLYHLAYNTYYTKPQQIGTSNILTDKNTDLVDLKSAITIIVMFARTYALRENIPATNTLERIGALKVQQILRSDLSDELVYAYNHLMKLRLRNQVELLSNGHPPSNILNINDLIEVETYVLKRVLTLLPVFQNKISDDFRIKM